jgi:hypothetical protein
VIKHASRQNATNNDILAWDNTHACMADKPLFQHGNSQEADGTKGEVDAPNHEAHVDEVQHY